MQGIRRALVFVCLLSTLGWASLAIRLIWSNDGTRDPELKMARWMGTCFVVTLASATALAATRHVRSPD
jgi:hypothetical protein